MPSEAKPGCDIDGLCVHLLAAFACPHCSDVAPTKPPEAVNVTEADKIAAKDIDDLLYAHHVIKYDRAAAQICARLAMARHREEAYQSGRADVDYWNEVARGLGYESVCEAFEALPPKAGPSSAATTIQENSDGE